MKSILDFTTAEQRAQWLVANAEYFTVIRRVNRSYERYEAPTLAAATQKARKLIGKHKNARYMIYAVCGPYDTYVQTVEG